MRKAVFLIVLFNLWISAFAKEDIYRNVLYCFYQQKMMYRYDILTKNIEQALEEGKPQDYVVIEDYSVMPDNVLAEIMEPVNPYRIYHGTKCEFEDSIGVYVAGAMYLSEDEGYNVIKDGEHFWYYYRNLGGQHMASVKKLWEFCKKHNYDTKQLLYVMTAFILTKGRNHCSFCDITYDKDYIYSYLEVDKNGISTFLDLLDNTERPISELFLTQRPRFAKINKNYLEDVLIFYSGDTIYYSPNVIRYQFSFLRQAFLLYLQRSITQTQLLRDIQ